MYIYGYFFVVSPEMYAHMTHHLSALSNGKIILILEGGYNLNAISLSMTLCTKALLGDPLPPLAPYKKPLSSAVETIREVIQYHSGYWSFIKGYDCLFPLNKNIDLKWKSDISTQQIQKEEEDKPSFVSDLLFDPTVDESIPTLPNKNVNINIDDDLVRDTEYIPLEFGASVAIAGINTVSNPVKHKESRINHIVNSKDYVIAKKSYVASTNIDIAQKSLTTQFDELKLTTSQEQAASMPELPVTFGCSNFDIISSDHAIHLQEDYIPFQYGSYPECSSIYTFTKSSLSGTSTTENTITTDSKSKTNR